MRPELNDASRREDDGGWGAPDRPRASPGCPRSTSRRARRRRARRLLVGAATSEGDESMPSRWLDAHQSCVLVAVD